MTAQHTGASHGHSKLAPVVQGGGVGGAKEHNQKRHNTKTSVSEFKIPERPYIDNTAQTRT